MHAYKTASLTVLMVMTSHLGTSAAVVFPKRGVSDQSTGFMESKLGSYWYRGSAAVARDPKLIYSCGHLFYEKGVWATQYNFYRAYHNQSWPKKSQATIPRGYRYFTNYSDNVASAGQNSKKAFAYDFTVFYGNNSFGPAVGWWPDGAAALKTNQLKKIVGYPSKIDYTGANGYCYQHSTAWFNKVARQSYGDYYAFGNVSTGGGNSGGPIFVQDESSGSYYIAGILVSGSRTTAGIYALNDSSNSMATTALGQATSTLQFVNQESGMLTDGGNTAETRSTNVSGFTGAVSEVKVSLSVSTARRGDLDIYLKSPSGRIRWINKQSKDSTEDIVIAGADCSKTFQGQAANGTWQLKMRDANSNNQTQFNSFGVTVTAPVE